MKRRFLAAALAAALILGGVSALAFGPPDSGRLRSGGSWLSGLFSQDEEPAGGFWNGLVQSLGEMGEPDPAPTPGHHFVSDIFQGLSLTVAEATGSLTVDRPELEVSAPMGQRGTWTIFVYLCGTDLESDRYGGMATADLAEMIAAADSDRVRFVVETGGTRRWANGMVDPNQNDRFLIQNGDITRVDTVPHAGMGESGTLADFLTWGVAHYSSEHMGVVLWDHGGGSITGVCFDERTGYDSLSLRELDAALLSVFGTMTDKFEFIGFDACLMGTVETANILASYADYMIGSEESEPGSGWDYTAMGDYLAAHPEADGAAVGRVVCDSFYESCRRDRVDDFATLAVIDLSRIDSLLVCFNRFAGSMYTASGDDAVLSAMVKGIRAADNFGGNNRADGYTNMVDLGGLIAACADWTEGAEEAMDALKTAVVYSVAGSDHRNASGLAVYYPLKVQGSEELTIFQEICVSPYYLSFVDRQSHGSVSGGDTADYDDGTWFNDGLWSWLDQYLYDDDTGYYDYAADTEINDHYWDYLDDYEPTGESSLITFDQEPQLDEDGSYYFVLSQDGLEYAADVRAYVFEIYEDGEDFVELGETYDVYVDWDTGFVCDQFDGCWLSLPDGQNLATYIVDVTDDYIIYSSPIRLNGRPTNLHLRQSWDGIVTVDGAWNGIDDYGAAEKEITRLQDGDVITPCYSAYIGDDLEDGSYLGQDYTVQGALQVRYDLMESGDYLYAFSIDDIYGDYYLSDFALFTVDDDGSVYFYEDW